MNTPDHLQAALTADFVINENERHRIPLGSTVFIVGTGKFVFDAISCADCEFSRQAPSHWPCNRGVMSRTGECGFKRIDHE